MKCKRKGLGVIKAIRFDFGVWSNEAHPYWMVDTTLITGESFGINGYFGVPTIKTKDGVKFVNHGDYIVGENVYEVLEPKEFIKSYEVVEG